MTKVGPELALHDAQGETRARLAVDKAGPALMLSDERGKLLWRAP